MWLGDIVKCDIANIVMSVLHTHTQPSVMTRSFAFHIGVSFLLLPWTLPS